MSKKIIVDAQIALKAEKAQVLQEELKKLETEVIIPKYQEYDAEYSQQVQVENSRHDSEIKALLAEKAGKRDNFLNEVKGKVNVKVEEEHHFDREIDALQKIIDLES